MPGDYVDEWIRPDAKPEKLVQAAMTEMVYEKGYASIRRPERWLTAESV
jgi:hypothetical protein